MPKYIDYVVKSFSQVLLLAEAVDYLGGSSKIQNAADKMKLKVTGSFARLIQAATKHGLIENQKGVLSITQLYKDYKHGYNADEKNQLLRSAFLKVPIYEKIYQRFKGNELPYDMIDKVLIREFEVSEDAAKTISMYFIEGAKRVGLIVNDVVIDTSLEYIATVVKGESDVKSEADNKIIGSTIAPINTAIKNLSMLEINNSTYTVHVYGNGINTQLNLEDSDDLVILNAIISKAKKKIKEKENAK